MCEKKKRFWAQQRNNKMQTLHKKQKKTERFRPNTFVYRNIFYYYCFFFFYYLGLFALRGFFAAVYFCIWSFIVNNKIADTKHKILNK